MKHTFELYITGDSLDKDDWNKLYLAMKQYVGSFTKYQIVVSIVGNSVRYFITSHKDIGSIGNNLNGVLLSRIESDSVILPQSTGKERFIQFVTGGNLLDLKEKYEVKRNKTLEYASFEIKAVNKDRAQVRAKFYFKDLNDKYVKSDKLFLSFPAQLLSVDFSSSNSKYLKSGVPRYLDIEKSMSLLTSDEQGSILEVDGFPYLSSRYFIGLSNYEFDKHSFIVGASGSGKSKLISLYVDALSKAPIKSSYKVVVIDPHAALPHDLSHIDDKKVVEFGIEGAELFSDGSQDVQAATELTATLFKDLIADQYSPRLERVLRFSLYVLFTAQAMSLDNLKRYVTDLEYRTKVLEHTKSYVPDNVTQFFGGDFNEMKTQHYSESIAPIVTLVEEMQIHPGMTGDSGVSLASTIQSNFLTVFSLNKVSMGEKAVKTVAGLLIQQIFLLAQSSSFNERIILIVDEVSIVQNPALTQILAEARKFNLFVVLTQQYFGQIEKPLQDSIFANVMNYYVFKVSEEDARALEGNLSINLPKSLVEEGHKKGLSESDIRVKILTDLNSRECLLRLSANGQLYPCIKARTVESKKNEHTATATNEPAHKQTSPGKFVESAAFERVKPAVEFSYDGHKRAEAVSNHDSAHSGSDVRQPETSTSVNLSELLAEHSASRILVNKKKGTRQ